MKATKYRIKQNAYGNWYGYAGKKKVAWFSETSTQTQKQQAIEWLERMQKGEVSR